MDRVILFKGAYATLDVFTEDINRELISRGFETFVFDVNDYNKSLMGMSQFLQQPVRVVIAYNNLGFNMELVPGKNIWDELNIPFINLLVDHPFHYKNALDMAQRNSLVLCIDRKHMEYVDRFWPHLQVGFMPHGTSNIEYGKKWNDRNIEVLYAGGLSKDLVEGLKPDVDKYKDFDGNMLVKFATDKLISNPGLTTEEVIEEFLVENKVTFDDERLSMIISDFRIVDSYAVSYYREKVIEELINNGIKVTVYGRGWEKRPCRNNPNFIFGGYVKPQEILELMKDSKIVLNTMTWFKDGSHVRIFNGMMAGAICVTDYSKYITEVLDDGVNGYVFSLTDMEKMVKDISYLLDDKNAMAAEQISLRARVDAEENHTFKQRVDFLLSYV